MRMLSEFVHRALSPFMTGTCMAALTVVDEPSAIVMILTAAMAFGFMSLPAGGRLIRRAAGLDHEA